MTSRGRLARPLHVSRGMKAMFASILFAFVIGIAGSACTATGSARYSATATMPSLVYISPGVQVIEDYHEPVFYSSNVYWRYDGGVWYRSRTYTGGWIRVATPPPVIVRIQEPSIYVHYRANAHAGAQARDQRRDDKAARRDNGNNGRKGHGNKK